MEEQAAATVETTEPIEEQAAGGSPTEPGVLGSLAWRGIGPFRGGRVVAVAGDPHDPATFYFGACAGGVWKSTDGGTYWENVSDGFLKTAAVGAIAVADSDPNVVYVGMGESCIRGNVSHGDGVYRSTDGGKSWTHLGPGGYALHLAACGSTRTIPIWCTSRRSGTPSGRTASAACSAPKMAARAGSRCCFGASGPAPPIWSWTRTIPASSTPRSGRSSGPPGAWRAAVRSSSIYRSTDGGDTWTEITDNPGLPGGPRGRIGVGVGAGSGRVWAIVEAEEGGLFRSDDGGDTWECLNTDRTLRLRPWYYCHVFGDPHDPDTVYVLNVQAWKSLDGGKTFTEMTTPHGDNHDLWIDPRRPWRMVEGNDGGACVSYNGGETWSTIYNQPTAQFYHLATDNQFPYRVYGTQQDNSAISTPSRSYKGAILWRRLLRRRQLGERPHRGPAGRLEHRLLRRHRQRPGGGGILLRYDHRTGQVRIVTVWPELYGGWGASDLKYRFQWTYPIVLSPHDPNVLYCTGNMVFRSTDEGSSWEPISPDLTRNDPAKLGPSGGVITRDTTGAETLLHHLRVCRVAARAGRLLGRI